MIDNIKSEPRKGLSGTCSFCKKPVIAKCGPKKIHHWSHKVKLECDTWWENETEWHRNWKGHFPVDWQEVIQYSDCGEKHIADVKTDQGWIIEFQNSFLSREEHKSRNDFYKKLIWVFNGKRLKGDEIKFKNSLNEVGSEVFFRIRLWGNAFLNKHISEKAVTFFDFDESNLWLLIPIFSEHYIYVMLCSKDNFIQILKNESKDESQRLEVLLDYWLSLAKEYDEKIEANWRQQTDVMHEQFKMKAIRQSKAGI